ncbi:SDR family oxidoreductase [Microbacterium luteolum]|uniref:SDR family oxidoreductase n=1 Tax=Microbacterium luteolum TaxID=69367 RepID=A0ABY7XVP3_MICLT|nr:SDR family oxidoreductase [Microbacterium luteolum]WDM45319.1 SDR family oxidoreductase [Microbacterium luteolum]
MSAHTTESFDARLHDRTIVLIGGGSGIGLEVARRSLTLGAEVVLGGRTPSRLEAAVAELGPRARWSTVDTSDEESITRFFADVPTVDGIFTTAADYVVGSMRDLDPQAATSPFESKFWGQYRVVHAALDLLSPEASIVLMSGAASVRPPAAAPAYVAANAAIEGLARGLAVELAPVRVNAVSPGTIDGNLWANRDEAARETAFAQFSADTLLGRPGTEGEVADAVIHLFVNGYTTGSTLYVDGGYSLR